MTSMSLDIPKPYETFSKIALRADHKLFDAFVLAGVLWREQNLIWIWP